MISKGIWIPTELMELDVSWTKRILIAEISQLEMLDKGCIASNAHFADKLKLSKQAVSKALNELEKSGYIVIDNAQTKRNFGRKITINFGKSAINDSKSAINFGKSDIHQSVESKGNKTINKTINTKKSIKKENHSLGFLNQEEVTYLDNQLKAHRENITLNHIKTFVDYRKRIKAPIKTVTPLVSFIKQVAEINSAGYSTDDAIEAMQSHEWRTVKLDWYQNVISRTVRTSSNSTEPEVGSIAWELAQQHKVDGVIDVEVDDE